MLKMQSQKNASLDYSCIMTAVSLRKEWMHAIVIC